MSRSSQLDPESCLNQSFGFILSKGRLTVVLLAQSVVTGEYFVVYDVVNNGVTGGR